MAGTFVLFPIAAQDAATIPAGWDDAAIIAQLSADLKTQLRREVRQMAEWNRRAALLRGLPTANDQEKLTAEDMIFRINRWFADMAWVADVDATLQPISTAIDPARVAALAKIAGQAAQRIAVIGAFVDGFNTATLLLSALQSEGSGVRTATVERAFLDASDSDTVRASNFSRIASSPVNAPAESVSAKQTPPAQAQAGSASADAAAVKARLELISTQVTANEAYMKTLHGTIPGSGEPAGKTTLGDGSGSLEGMLLSADILNLCAEKLAARVADALEQGKQVIVLSGSQQLEVGLWRAVQGRIAALQAAAELSSKAVEEAKQAFSANNTTRSFTALAIAPIAAAVTATGTVLANLSNLASYFQTSWSTRGFVVEGTDDAYFANAVATALLGSGLEVYVSGTAADEARAVSLFKTILEMRQQAEIGKTTVEALQKSLLMPATQPPNGVPLPLSDGTVEKVASAGAALGATMSVIQACDALITSLTSPDAAGAIPFTALASQATLGATIDRGALVLRIKVHKTLAGIYTKEDGKIRALFRSQENDAPELYVSGGAVVSFSLHNVDGRVLAAGTLRDQTKYLQLDLVDGWLE